MPEATNTSALKPDERMYKNFFDHAKIPMILLNDDTTIALCNKAFQLMSGYTAETVEGKMSWARLVADPDQLELMLEYHKKRRITSSYVPEEYEFNLRTSDNNIRNIALSISMVPGSNQSLAYLQDITEKKQSEVWYRAVFENTGLPSIIIEAGTTIIKANTEWAILSGYSIEENEGKLSWTTFVHPDDLGWMKEFHSKRRQNPSDAPRKYEFRFVRRNGEVRQMINSVTMIPDSNYSIASLLDLTELKETEIEKNKLEVQLEQARKLESIGQLAGGIAHDFNNMLSAILGYSELAQGRILSIHKKLDEKQEQLSQLSSDKHLQNFSLDRSSVFDKELELLLKTGNMMGQVINAAQRAGVLTKQLLAFARKQTLEIRPINLNEVISGFAPIIRRTIRENVEIDLQLHQDINSTEADPGQIEQILLNLAVNAQDAMPTGGKLCIKTDNQFLDATYTSQHEGILPGPFVLLEVSDTGHGMDSETRQKVFEPFFTTKETGKGTGLGLATVYGIVKQHSGHISFFSEPDKGTSFRIYLPKSSHYPEIDLAPSADVDGTGDETILVVEDQKHVLEMTTTLLSQLGYTIFSASNGHDAIEKVRGHHEKIDLLISDVVMPGMNGRELYDSLIQFLPDIKVLFISGYPMEIISHHGILDKGFNFLAKPVPQAMLKQKIREILDSE